MEDENKESKKEIEIINGNGKDLDFSEVSEYIKTLTNPTEGTKTNKEIVIPKSKSDKKDN